MSTENSDTQQPSGPASSQASSSQVRQNGCIAAQIIGMGMSGFSVYQIATKFPWMAALNDKAYWACAVAAVALGIAAAPGSAWPAIAAVGSAGVKAAADRFGGGKP